MSKILHLDHLVLTVASLEKTVHFYCDILGMEKEVFLEGRIALKFGNQKINLHLLRQEFEPKAERATAGSADLCFLVDSVADMENKLREQNVEIIEGPIERTGATGPLLSIYIRDPDLNLIELSELA